MPINNNSAFYDALDEVYWPKDFIKWDDLGNGFNSTTTITSVGGASVNNGALSFGQAHSSYWQLTYNNSIRLHDRTDWTVEFRIRINTDSTSTTNFQTANDGIIVCQGDGDISATPFTDRPNWAIYLDNNNVLHFAYQSGGTHNDTTSSGWSLGNDDYYDVSFKKSGLTLSVYINNQSVGSTTLNSDDISASTDDLFIGGNPGGDYLYNADIDAIRIRKDNFSGDTLTANGDLHMIDPTESETASYDGKWDTDVLLYLPVTETSGTTTDQAYLKTFPDTWGTWTSWFVNPIDKIDVTTSTITFDQPTKGFKEVSITTTDGFLCAFGAGEQDFPTDFLNDVPSRSWRGRYNNSATAIHAQGGDIDFITPTAGFERASLETVTSTNFNLKLPTRGYYPASETIGKRPRGLKKILYEFNQKAVLEAQSTTSDNHIFTLGMPYFESVNGSIRQEGGFYMSGDIGFADQFNFRDWDFRWNHLTLHIQDIEADSADAIVVTTVTDHGLSTGDSVYMRLGVPYTATLDQHNDAWEPFQKINGVKYIQVIDSTSFKLFYDSSRANVVTHAGSIPQFNSSTCQTYDTVWYNYVADHRLRLLQWTKLFEGVKEVDVGSMNYGIQPEFVENANLDCFTSHIGPSVDDAYSDSLYTTVNNLNLRGKRSAHTGNFTSIFDSFTPDYKPVPKGTQADPFVIRSTGGNVTSSAGGPMAPIYIAMDTRYGGTLKISVTDIETADSTTPTDLKYSVILNGEGNPSGAPTLQTQSVGSTISIAVTEKSRTPAPLYQVFTNISLMVYLDGVVHTDPADRSRATYTIWFEPETFFDVGTNEKVLFYAGGLQPGRNTLETRGRPRVGANFTEGSVIRPSNWALYQNVGSSIFNKNQAVDVVIKGIPPIAYSVIGETYYSNTLNFPNIQGQGDNGTARQLYQLPYVSENNHYAAEGGVTVSAAPWLEQATMTRGMKRIYAGFVYECQVDHISSKNFDDDYNLGYWTITFRR